MNYPMAIVIAAVLIAGTILAKSEVGAASGAVGRYQISAIEQGGVMGAFRIDTSTGVMDLIGCAVTIAKADPFKPCAMVLDAVSSLGRK